MWASYVHILESKKNQLYTFMEILHKNYTNILQYYVEKKGSWIMKRVKHTIDDIRV